MKKILLAEDNEDTLYVMARVLRKNSFEVIECMDGLEAFEKAKIHKPDLVIVDVRMPKMDGFKACAKLKSDKQTKDIPVIIQSATYFDVPNKVKGLELGANDYLSVPINFDELLARINTQLRIKRLENELKDVERLKAINETIRTMHHEINNPLAIIQGWVQILPLNSSLDKETINGLKKIEKSTLRIKEVLQKLSHITKPVKTLIFDGNDTMIDIDQSDSSSSDKD